MPQPDADHEHVLTYCIKQLTTSKDPEKVAQKFYDEVKLQFGSTVAVESVTVQNMSECSEPVPIVPPGVTYQEQRDLGLVQVDGAVGGS